MIVLGLNHGEINSSAALVVDGKVVAAAPEERFSRVKRTKAFPSQAMAYCLRSAGMTLADVDYVAQAWNPGASWVRYNAGLSGQRVKREDYFYTVPDNLLNTIERKPADWVLMSASPGASMPPTYFLTHHRAHQGSAFFLSPFDRAALLTCDFRGEVECTTLALGEERQVMQLHRQLLPDSLGMFYATFTELLGYEPDADEWKVMALSAFDADEADLYRRIRSTIRFADEGRIEVDQSYYKVMNVEQPRLYTPKLVELVGGREGRPGEEPDEWHYAVARAMQRVSEDVAVHFLNELHRRTNLRQAVLSGGFFMNCVFNGKVTSLTPFDAVSISYAPADV